MGHLLLVVYKGVFVLQGIIEKWIPGHENEDNVNVAIPSQGRSEPSCRPAEAAITVPQLLDMEEFEIKHGDRTADNTTTFSFATSSSTFDEIMTGDIGDLLTAAIDRDGTGSLSDATALFHAIYGSIFAFARDDSLLGELSQSVAATNSG